MKDRIGSLWPGTELMDVGRAGGIEVWWDPWEGLELETSPPGSGGSHCEIELNALLLHGVKPSGDDIGSARARTWPPSTIWQGAVCGLRLVGVLIQPGLGQRHGRGGSDSNNNNNKKTQRIMEGSR